MPAHPGKRKKAPNRYTGPGYSLELAKRVCDRVAEGYSLNRACEMDGDGLYGALFHFWRKEHSEEVQPLYDDARMSQLEAWADEIVDIADGMRRTEAQREEMAADGGGRRKKAERIMSFGDGDEDGSVPAKRGPGRPAKPENEDGSGKKGRGAYDYHAVKRDFLRIDSRKWLLSKLNPAKWGDRVQTQVTGPEGGALMVQVVRFGDLPVTEQVELKATVRESLPEPAVDVPVVENRKRRGGNGKTVKADS